MAIDHEVKTPLASTDGNWFGNEMFFVRKWEALNDGTHPEEKKWPMYKRSVQSVEVMKEFMMEIIPGKKFSISIEAVAWG